MRGPRKGGTVGNRGLSEAGRARVSEIQRARIVAAMVEVVAERGLADASVARVVKRAGVSRRTFYELFEDREDCFLAALEGGIAQASRSVRDAYDPAAKWVERVRAALSALLCLLDAEPRIAQLLIVGSLGAGPKAQERRQRGIAQIIAVVDEGREESRTGSQLPPLTAVGIVGGALSILHGRLMGLPSAPIARSARGVGVEGDSLFGLVNPLMSMIVLPYLGPAAARRELKRRVLKQRAAATGVGEDPLRELGMRLTYRTVRVLMSVAALEGPQSYPSNREVGESAGIGDQGQISKLLARLERLGLVRNTGLGPGKGAPNAWALTARGLVVERAMSNR